MNIKQFTFIVGLILLSAGLLGFFPPLLTLSMMPDDGLLFGLFAVNWLRNIVYLSFGIWGMVASKDILSSKTYNKITSITFAVFFILGLIPMLSTLYGLLPLYGHNTWFHAIVCVSTAYFGYAWGTHGPLIKHTT